jgi:arginyl-tRNA synthetase
VLRHAREAFSSHEIAPAQLAKAELSLLTDRDELALIRLLTQWPSLVEGAATTYEPHRVAYYLQEVAAAFHGLWNKGNADATLRFIQSDAKPVTLARLALVQAVAFVIASGLHVMGVTPLEELRG